MDREGDVLRDFEEVAVADYSVGRPELEIGFVELQLFTHGRVSLAFHLVVGGAGWVFFFDWVYRGSIEA